MSVPNPLDRPVDVDLAGPVTPGRSGDATHYLCVVRPSDVLAALDDDAREAMVDQALGAILDLPDVEPHAEDAARAVVDAICGGRS